MAITLLYCKELNIFELKVDRTRRAFKEDSLITFLEKLAPDYLPAIELAKKNPNEKITIIAD